MPTPEKVYRVKQSREEMLRKKREGMKRWRDANPEAYKERCRQNHIKHRAKILERVNRWAKQNPDKVLKNMRRAFLMSKYGMTPEEWSFMFSEQNECCAICKTPEPHGKRRQWDTDHCHETGRVRGILCHPCNMMLGGAKDNPDTLRTAISYLMDNPA